MIYYNVKNKATGNISVVTKQAKETLEKIKDYSKKYEILGECDMHGRNFDYANFLNEANGKQSIGIEAIEKESEKCENANGGIDGGNITVGPIQSIEEIGTGNGNGQNNDNGEIENGAKTKRNYNRKNK